MLCGSSSEILNLKGIISAEKSLTGKLSVSVKDVPYFEVSNSSGGTTVYIGKELVDNGSK